MNSRSCLMWLLLTVTHVSGQYWVRGVGGPSNDAFADMVMDATGNVYVTGEFGSAVEIGNTTLTTFGSLDILVAKFDAQGGLVWATHFGGPGLDRGIALALGSAGELVVVGQYMATSTFGSVQSTASGATQDAFTVSMSADNGEVAWVRSSGGADWVDQPSGVSVGPNGEIAVTGEFRGTAQFGTETFTSTMDPETEEPSVDIYIQTYSSNGTPGWSKHGAAERADRGMDIDHAPSGDIIVTGQFSDTLSLGGIVHNNATYSAVFIVRYSPTGAEQWFRIFGGGSYNQVFDVLVTPSDRILLTGDMQGMVIFQDQVPDLFTAAAPRSSFLLEVSPSGELAQRTTWGSQHDQSTRSLSVHDDEVAVLGRFACQYTGFSDIYGEGTFLATGAYDLYVARFELEGFAFKDAQQFGGTGTKSVGAIVHDLAGLPIFNGAFAEELIFPMFIDEFWALSPNAFFLYSSDVSTYCGDQHYSTYMGFPAVALKDAFVARGFVPERQPYDFFDREEGSACVRDIPPMRIMATGTAGIHGPDSITVCDSTSLQMSTTTSFSGTNAAHTSPDFDLLWSDGDTLPLRWVSETGWYHVTATSRAGCLSGSDSIFVTVNLSPERPLISDDQGVNNEALATQPIIVCAPEEPWLWATNIAPGDTVRWSFNELVYNDSLLAETSGNYYVEVLNEYGCSSGNVVEVRINPNEPLDDLELDFDILYPQDTDQNDSIVLCPSELVNITAQLTITTNGDTISLPYGIRVLMNCGGGWQEESAFNTASCSVWPPGIGWLTTTVRIALTNAPCGTDTIFAERVGSIHVRPVQLGAPIVTVTGPQVICPGDTAAMVATCTNCTSFSWSQNTVWVDGLNALANAPGYYSFYAQRTDTNGCAVNVSASHTVQQYPRPSLGSFPMDAIICPDSIAIIFSDSPGLSYQWYGPMGPLGTQNDSIITSQPGEYYLELVDLEGCAVNSDPILITDYATPYLNVTPDGVLCEEGETAELQVVTTSEATLQWASPLGGAALLQSVDQPGTYTCTVEACGIVTPLSTIIYGAEVEALVLRGDSMLACEGTSIELEALAGQAYYFWQPGDFIGPVYAVGDPGTYTLIASDQFGCSDTTAVVVEFVPVPEPISASTESICTGDSLIFQAAGSGTLIWSTDQAGTSIIATGPLVHMGVVSIPGEVILYVRQDMGPCSTDPQAINATVYATPQIPLILGPDSLCAGEPFELTTTGQEGDTFTWTTPNGVHVGDELISAAAVFSDAGTYSILTSNPACSVQGPPVALVVLQAIPFSLGNDTIFCEGSGVELVLPSGYNEPVWNTTETTASIYITGGGIYSVVATDANGCSVSDDIEVIKIVCEVEPPNVITPNGDGINDTWAPLGMVGGPVQLQVFNRFGDLVWFGDPIRTPFKGIAQTTGVPLSDGVYYYAVSYTGEAGGLEEKKGYIQLMH